MLVHFLALITLVTAIAPFAAASRADPPTVDVEGGPGIWSGWGGNIFNNRWAYGNTGINSSAISYFVQRCLPTYHYGVSATPTVSGDLVLYPTWDGLFVALNYAQCQVLWSINVTDIVYQYAPVTADQLIIDHAVSRTSPQVDEATGIVYFGTGIHALIVAVSLQNGTIYDVIQINSHPHATLTMSPTFFNYEIFIGSSSVEETAADFVPGYVCCDFVGNFAALQFDNYTCKFSVKWNITMLPIPAGNWSGAALWGSQPSIDESRSQVFIATGNLYTAPDNYSACEAAQANITQPVGNATDLCLPPNIWQESVLAVDINTGSVNWVRQLTPLDSWTVACGWPPAHPRNVTLCPGSPGPDADFGMAPAFVYGSVADTPNKQDTVVVGQKNGNLYALSAIDGSTLWATVTSPDGTEGGLSWGVAVDDVAVYFTAINYNGVPFQLPPSNVTVNNSAYGAASLSNGTLLWETAAPNNSISFSPPSVVNDIVIVGLTGQNYAGQGDVDYDYTNGSLIVMNKANGSILVNYMLDANMHGGIAVYGEYLMFGTGYRSFDQYNGTGSLYVLEVDAIDWARA